MDNVNLKKNEILLIFRTTTTRAVRFASRLNRCGSGQNGDQADRVTGGSSNSANRNLDNQLKTRRKVAKMLIAVVIMFSINFFPVHFLPVLQVSFKRFRHDLFKVSVDVIRNTFQNIIKKNVSDEKTKENWMALLGKAAIISHCMCYFNSAINPIIYYFMSAQFKVSAMHCSLLNRSFT